MGFRSQSSTPPIVLNLLLANIMAFVATAVLFDSDRELFEQCYDIYGLHPLSSPFFEWWQPVTYMFLHGGVSHLFFNMFALWMFGRGLEWDLGWKRFLTYYLVCGIGAAAVQLGIAEAELSHMTVGTQEYAEYMRMPTIGASGAVFGLLLAFGMLHPNATIMLLIPPIPMKAKWFVIVYGAAELLFGVSGKMDSVAHFAHLGGMFWGWLLLMWWSYRDKRRYRY